MQLSRFSQIVSSFFSEANQLKRIILFTGIALVLLVLSFGGYYYWDRYVHLGDDSPVGKSIQELEKSVEKDPQNVELRLALAETYMLDSQYDKAVDQSSQVLSNYPENDRAMFVMGVSYASQEKWEQAIDPLKRFSDVRSKLSTVNLDNSLETALFYLGKSYLALDRSAEAIPVLSQAIQINKTDADAYYLLGISYAKTQDHEKAIQNYQEAVRFVPNFIEAYEGMVESYSALNKPEYAAYARGMADFSKMKFESARKELEAAVKKLPDFAPAYIGLGLTCEELGDLQSAKSYLERALQIDPNNFTASQALGRIQVKTQK